MHLLLAAGATAQPAVQARGRSALYKDSDHTTITTLGARAAVEPVPTLRIGGGYLADIVSSASVDVVSAATKSFEETRHEGDGDATLLLDDVEIGGRYRYSVENDWRSHTGVLHGVQRTMQKNTEYGFTLALSWNAVGRTGDPHFSRRLMSYGYAANVTQLLDPRTVVSFVYDGSYNRGFQSSPYRYVVTSDRQFTVLEHHPEVRTRHALGVGALRHLGRSTSGRLDYRIYVDDWGVGAHTAELRFSRDLGEFLSLSLRERFYAQGAAWFYEQTYAAPRRYMSADRELSSFWDSFTGGIIAVEVERVGPFATLGADVAADYFFFRFKNYTPLVSRSGFVASIGILGSL